jgi:hypothetical protein
VPFGRWRWWRGRRPGEGCHPRRGRTRDPNQYRDQAEFQEGGGPALDAERQALEGEEARNAAEAGDEPDQHHQGVPGNAGQRHQATRTVEQQRHPQDALRHGDTEEKEPVPPPDPLMVLQHRQVNAFRAEREDDGEDPHQRLGSSPQ